MDEEHKPTRGRPRKHAEPVETSALPEAADEVVVGRARVSRELAERRARRERAPDLDGHRLKLTVPEAVKEPGFAYRWVNDDGMRVHALTNQDDWEVDPKVEPRRVGTKADGKPLMAYLIRKPEEWQREDRAKKQKAVDRSMEAISGRGRGETVNIGGGSDSGVGYVAVDTSVRRG